MSAGSPHDRPTASEMVEAVREWLENEVTASTGGRLSFHARVAANMLAMVEREMELGATMREAHESRLASLGCVDDRDLAARIRSGELDHTWPEVVAAVAASVRDKLAVANPRYLAAD
jgi:hypothetical protein